MVIEVGTSISHRTLIEQGFQRDYDLSTGEVDVYQKTEGSITVEVEVVGMEVTALRAAV